MDFFKLLSGDDHKFSCVHHPLEGDDHAFEKNDYAI